MQYVIILSSYQFALDHTASGQCVFIPICHHAFRPMCHFACESLCADTNMVLLCVTIFMFTLCLCVCIYAGRVYRGYVELYCITMTFITMLLLGDSVMLSLGDCTGGESLLAFTYNYFYVVK